MAATSRPPAMPPHVSTSSGVRLTKRHEPGKLPAALFAIVVHLGFFALIVFGVTWQVKPPAILNADIWRDLPAINTSKPPPVKEVERVNEPKIEPKVEPKLPPPPAPAAPPAPPQPTKADIALKEKTLKQEKLKLEQQKLEAQKKIADKKKADEDKARRVEEAKLKVVEDKARAEAASREAAREAALRGARDKSIQDYASKVGALIRQRANIADSVTGKPIVEVRLRLLVNGAVLDAQIVKPSGNRIFDESVERAINGIRQWPLPEDVSILGGRRELILRIEHEQ